MRVAPRALRELRGRAALVAERGRETQRPRQRGARVERRDEQQARGPQHLQRAARCRPARTCRSRPARAGRPRRVAALRAQRAGSVADVGLPPSSSARTTMRTLPGQPAVLIHDEAHGVDHGAPLVGGRPAQGRLDVERPHGGRRGDRRGRTARAARSVPHPARSRHARARAAAASPTASSSARRPPPAAPPRAAGRARRTEYSAMPMIASSPAASRQAVRPAPQQRQHRQERRQRDRDRVVALQDRHDDDREHRRQHGDESEQRSVGDLHRRDHAPSGAGARRTAGRMPEAGIEPAQSCPRRILSPVRLPVPPLRRRAEGSLSTGGRGAAAAGGRPRRARRAGPPDRSTPSRSAPAPSARCASASERMPPCALTTPPGGSSPTSAAIASGVAPSGPRPVAQTDAVAAGGVRHARRQPPGRGLQVARLDHRAHDDVPALGRGARRRRRPRPRVRRARRGSRRWRAAAATRRRRARRRRRRPPARQAAADGLRALGAERQSDRRHDAHRRRARAVAARRRDERRQHDDRSARELLRARPRAPPRRRRARSAARASPRASARARSTHGCSQPEPLQQRVVTPPATANLNSQVEVDASAQQILDRAAAPRCRWPVPWRRPCRPGCPAGSWPRRSAWPTRARRACPRGGLDLVDDDRDRVRHLLARARERLLAHELGDAPLERLVGVAPRARSRPAPRAAASRAPRPSAGTPSPVRALIGMQRHVVDQPGDRRDRLGDARAA